MDSLERFAHIRAAIEIAGNRDRALRDAGLAPSEWIQLQRRWLDALATEIASGSDTLATRYCQAFEAARSPVSPAKEPDPVEVVEPPHEVAMHVPSFLKTSVAAAPIAPAVAVMPAVVTAPADLRSTSLSFEVPRMPAVPFKPSAAPEVIPSPAPAPAPKPAPRFGTGTSLMLDVPRGPSTPFRADNEASMPANTAAAADTAVERETTAAHEAPSEPRVVRPAFGTGTSLSLDLPRGPSTPFHADAAAPRPAIATPSDATEEHSAPPPSEPRVVRPAFGTGTSLSLDIPRAVTPFLTTSSTPAAPVAPATPAPAATTAPAAPTHAAPTFAAPAAPAALPELSVEQYAWLVAALRRAAPADVPAMLARFRLTAETRKELEARWATRMAADATIKEAFLAALGRYLSGGRG